MALRIEDYALIGDSESAALVGRDGSIDWLCWPRFDSEACFAALLGTEENGRWLIAPEQPSKSVKRRYRKNTLILETRFETTTGAATVIDFLPLRNGYSDLVRIVVGEHGEVTMCAELILRFGYGAIVPWMTRHDAQTLVAIAGPDMVVLRSPVKLHGEGFKSVGRFTLKAGDRIPFVLTHCASHYALPKKIDAEAALQSTESFWIEWTLQGNYSGPYAEHVARSLITLKAQIYAPTGGIVAAPTTSLPEKIGGQRNWDYRFCWLRDATLTLLALMNGGHYAEAAAWRDWLLRAVAGSPDQIQIMYGIAGERRLAEWEVTWLPGYENSAPVRIGNQAHQQLQLDVYGELMDVLHQARKGGIPKVDAGWELQLALLSHLEAIWREPDEGIWEIRGERQHFTHSKVMAWVAFDRMIKDVEEFGMEGPVERWRSVRAEIHADVCARGFDPQLGCFVRSYGSRELDASLLLLPAVGFLPPTDRRILGTIAAIEQRLLVDGFVLRYDTARADDGLPPGEGAFLACSFWLADAYVLLGRFDEAHALYERLVGLANDVGLLSEEYDPQKRRLVGNFPQAFSHIALINTTFNLTRAQKPAEQRAEKTKTPAV
ncbi:MAG: glycoside hydrolase family 15 protein [Pseudorhodoplanes sp.]